jgi:hypothetical protein
MHSRYFWQDAAGLAERVKAPVIDAYRGEPIESITFITSRPQFLRWAILDPMLPELMGIPGLQVTVVAYEEAQEAIRRADASNLVFDFDNGVAELGNN